MTSNEASDYLVSQTRDNISLLLLIGRISKEDARDILSRIPAVKSPLHRPDTNYLSAGYERPPSRNLGHILDRPPPPPPNLRNHIFKAKAIWGYNEDRKEINDLSFAAGDVIEVLENSDSGWWKGRFNGLEGLFPSSYVERLPPVIPSTPKPVPSKNNSSYPDKMPLPTYQNAPYPAPSPYSYPQQGSYINSLGPTPPNGPYPQYLPPPPGLAPPPAVVVPTDAQQPTGGKKNKIFGGSLGNTLAHSAAGGVGFGAGSALASDLVNSIF